MHLNFVLRNQVFWTKLARSSPQWTPTGRCRFSIPSFGLTTGENTRLLLLLISLPQTLSKEENPFTENYSILSPEVLEDEKGNPIAQKNTGLIKYLLEFDAVFVAEQAKSHCVAWTIADLLSEIQNIDSQLAQKVYLLEDCTSPVVVPGVADYSKQADAAFQGFAAAGMHLVKSTDAIDSCF